MLQAFELLHRSFSPVPAVCCLPFGANPQAVHFVKEYTPLVDHTWNENHKYDHKVQPTKAPGSKSSSTYFENKRPGSQLSISKHLVGNITAIMHNVYVIHI